MVWLLRLQDDREQGEAAAHSTAVALDSLSGRIMRLNVRKRPGHEQDDVLGDPEDGSSSPEGAPVSRRAWAFGAHASAARASLSGRMPGKPGMLRTRINGISLLVFAIFSWDLKASNCMTRAGGQERVAMERSMHRAPAASGHAQAAASGAR